jgi:hypothetical protein
MDNKIFVPSFEVEKKTKAFNKYIWFFVFLLLLFPISVFLGAFFYAFMTSFLEIVDYQNSLLCIVIIPCGLFVFTAYQLYLFLQALLTSYKIENSNLVKGKIINKDKVDLSDIAIDSVFVADGIKNIGNVSRSMHNSSAANMYKIIRLIECNLNSDFVNQYFDTPLYKKVEYKNAKLINETKYSLIYTSENKKKIVVPKIYDGMFNINNSEESSFIKRIIERTLCIFTIALLSVICLLCIQNKSNINDLNAISNPVSIISQKLDDYGYVVTNNGPAYYIYKKVVDETKTSTIKYVFKSDGSTDDVNIQLYYNDKSYNVENELRAILDSTGYEFANDDKEKFIENVINSINGNYVYDKLSSGNFSILIGKSEGYIDIH